MRTVRRTIPLLAAIAVGFLLIAPVAQPAMIIRGSRSATLSLQGSNGYSILVERVGRQVSLIAVREGNRYVVSTGYATRGEASPTGIDARFGKFGRISVEFKVGGKVRTEKPPKGCTGKVATRRFGKFVGTIKFTGERGYTKVDSRRAQGSVSESPDWACKSLQRFGRVSLLGEPAGAVPRDSDLPAQSGRHDELARVAERLLSRRR